MSGFGNHLKETRERAGLSLSAAADLIGCTKSHLWDMERGRSRNPSVTILAGLASAYSVDIGDLARVAAASMDGSERRKAVEDLMAAKKRLAALG